MPEPKSQLCKLSSIAITLFLMIPLSVSAQELKQPVTLTECIQLAQENSSRITIAKRALDTAQIGVKDACAGYLPKLEADAGYQLNNTHSRMEWTKDHYSANLILSETIYDNGRTPAGVRQAKARLESARVDFQRMSDELTFEVISAYYSLLKAQKMQAVKDEGLKQSGSHLKLAQARYDAGTAPRSDILKAEVEVSTAELGLIEAENTLSLARADLNNIMGMELDTRVMVVETDPTSLTSPTNPTSQTGLTDHALKNRPEIRQAEIGLLVDEINLRLAGKEVWPGITLEASYQADVDQLINKNNWSESTAWQMGLKMRFPIFDAGQNRRGVTKAEINLANSRTNLEQLKKDITLSVSRAYLSLNSQKKMLETTEKQAAQARESRDAAQGRYETGVGTILEVIDAQASLNAANTNYIKAVYDYQIAVFSLKKAMGENML